MKISKGTHLRPGLEKEKSEDTYLKIGRIPISKKGGYSIKNLKRTKGTHLKNLEGPGRRWVPSEIFKWIPWVGIFRWEYVSEKVYLNTLGK